MKLPALLVADLHLTVNPKDDYKWLLFPWLCEMCKEYEIETVAILGDLTDAKDFHSSRLVNRVVDRLARLADVVPKIIILKGNHDYLKDGDPFFQFLNEVPGIKFVTEPYPNGNALFLPHSKSPESDWKGLDFDAWDFVFMHQTMKGSVAANGQKMESGLSLSKTSAKIYSGDIHVPQTIGGVEYVGSPYPVHFGDNFKARSILLEANGAAQDLYLQSLYKHSITITCIEDLYRLGTEAGDHIKIDISLPVSDRQGWETLKAQCISYCRNNDLVLFGIRLAPMKLNRKKLKLPTSAEETIIPSRVVESFAHKEGVGAEVLDVGLEITE